MPVERCHVSDVIARLVVFNHRNRRQTEMEVAVTAVLADVPSQLTARDVFGDWRILLGFKPSRRTASQAAGGPPPESLADAGGVDD